MSPYYVFYEELIPGPRTLYFSGPIHSAHMRAGMPKVGDEIEFRHLEAQIEAQSAEGLRAQERAQLRAQIRSIEAIDNRSFRFTAQPLAEQWAEA